MGIQTVIPRHGFHAVLDGYNLRITEVEWKPNSIICFHCETIPHPKTQTLHGHPKIYRGKMLWRTFNDSMTLTLLSSCTYQLTLNVSFT